jgi:serine/threonine protein kinase
MVGDRSNRRYDAAVAGPPALDSTLTAASRDGDASADADRTGRVGRYEILGKLGAGGMGVVYRANDPVLDRHVALKVIGQSQRKLGSTATDRLVREARALAKLAHPNVIAIHDVGQVGDEAFVAMELVHGRTLDDWLRVSPRTTAEILDVFVQASRGLEAAHGAGLVHRDFKPSNVIIGDDGRVRVLDFGLARLAEAPDPSDAGDASTDPLGAITRTGGIVGTPAYMAPEQCGDGKVDERCDQFSFCVTLYQALYGCLPFATTSLADRNARIVAGELTPPTTEREVPEQVRAAVLRGLAAEPDRRYASMQELAAKLAWKSPPGGRRRALYAGVALLGLVVLVVIWLLAGRDGGRHDVVPTRAERLRMLMIDNTSSFPSQLSEHVRTDAQANRLDIKPEELQWNQPDGTQLTEQYVSGADRASLEAYLATLPKDLAVERGHELLVGRHDNRWRTFYVWARVELDGSSIRTATVTHGGPSGAPQVRIDLDAKGANLLAATTGQNIGRRIATVVDGTVSSAFIITAPILGGVLAVTMGGSDASSQERAAAELAHDLSP